MGMLEKCMSLIRHGMSCHDHYRLYSLVHWWGHHTYKLHDPIVWGQLTSHYMGVFIKRSFHLTHL
eukprot:6480736-Amphidinium_carterae.1